MSSAPHPSPAVPGWPAAFRGSAAVAAGLVTWTQLRGPRYVRLFPDVYAPVPDEPPDLALRSRGAYRYAGGRGVLSGYSAAELLGASCAPKGAPAEVTVPGGGLRTRPALRVHRDRLAQSEVQACGDVLVTTPLRTAYDLARWNDLTEAVVAIDALANKGRFSPELLLHQASRYPRARGAAGIARAVALSDAKAGSPMESRLRMIIIMGGLPAPEVQYVVADDRRRTAVWLDMAYPEHRIGIEYEGADHAHPDRVLRDAGRYTRLVDGGWRIYRYTKYQVYNEPDTIVADLTRALSARVR